MADNPFQGRSFPENPLPIVMEVIDNSNEDVSDPGKPPFRAVSNTQNQQLHNWERLRVLVSGNFVHSVVSIRLCISCDEGTQPNEGQSNETHEKKQRTT